MLLRKRRSLPEMITEQVSNDARRGLLTRGGVAYLLGKYVRQASESMPHLRTLRVTPHVMRHSCDVALRQAGTDVSVIRDYLDMPQSQPQAVILLQTSK